MIKLLVLSISLIFHTMLYANVGFHTIIFTDKTRHRQLITNLYYPTDASINFTVDKNAIWKTPPKIKDASLSAQCKQYPLIIFSHGDGGSREESEWFTVALAEAGYIVVSLDHYGNTWNNYLAEISLRRWERPKDVSFVLRQLLQDPSYAQIIDRKKIGFAGYSLGGTTGVWLAGGIANLYQKPSVQAKDVVILPKNLNQQMLDHINFNEAKKSYRDPLIKAIFLMAPAYGFAFDAKGLNTITIPTYIITGDRDEIVPKTNNAQKFTQNIPNVQLKIIPNANHYIFINEPTKLGKKTLSSQLIIDPPGVNRRATHDFIIQVAKEFFSDELNYPRCLNPSGRTSEKQ